MLLHPSASLTCLTKSGAKLMSDTFGSCSSDERVEDLIYCDFSSVWDDVSIERVDENARGTKVSEDTSFLEFFQ